MHILTLLLPFLGGHTISKTHSVHLSTLEIMPCLSSLLSSSRSFGLSMRTISLGNFYLLGTAPGFSQYEIANLSSAEVPQKTLYEHYEFLLFQSDPPNLTSSRQWPMSWASVLSGMSQSITFTPRFFATQGGSVDFCPCQAQSSLSPPSPQF